MNVKVGKVYKCDGHFIKIVMKLEEAKTCYRHIGVECNKDGKLIYLRPWIGAFNPEGDWVIGRSDYFIRLEEIEEEVEEMTVAQISKALNKNVKIVKEGT